MKRVCIFCGANKGNIPAYAESVRKLGKTLAKRKIGLVYGGGNIGLMGLLADTVMAAGGEAFGVIPRFMKKQEVAHEGLTQLFVVGSMHQRKSKMEELSDGFIALPGGIGTLEEFFEVWSWAQLGIHVKPFGILNVAGYFNPLIAMMDHIVSQGFMKPKHRAMVFVDSDLDALLDKMDAYRPAKQTSWMDLKKT